MYLIREGGRKAKEPLFQTLKNDDPSCAALFFPERSTAQWFYDEGMPEKGLITWVRDTLIKPEEVFVDIGAHVGTYAWTCAPRAKHTYAFECNPRVFCYLAANVALHGLEHRISPLPFALGPQEGVMDYIVRSEDGGGNGVKAVHAGDEGRPRIPVQVRTLDSFKLERVGCIKIDVEGFEKEVLQGARDTIARCRPKILFECWDRYPALKEELFTYITGELGYKIIPLSGAREMYLAEPLAPAIA